MPWIFLQHTFFRQQRCPVPNDLRKVGPGIGPTHRSGRRLGKSGSATSKTSSRACTSVLCAGPGMAHAHPSAVWPTARWTATESVLHQRRAHAAFRRGSHSRRGSARAKGNEALDQLHCVSVPPPTHFAAEHCSILCGRAGVRLASACERRHKGRIAAKGSTQGCGAVDDEVEAPAAVGGDGWRSGVGEPLLGHHVSLRPYGFASKFAPSPFNKFLHPHVAGQSFLRECSSCPHCHRVKVCRCDT